MSDATLDRQTMSLGVTIRPEEAEHFGALAKDWWDPKGSSAMLHKLNPIRLQFVREAVDVHWGFDSGNVRPLAGKGALDVGCGAGLLCEPLARLGADVTGVDAAPQNIQAAAIHAGGSALDIRYLAGEIGAQDIGRFDLVTSMEVIEHVADKAAFLADLKARMKPDGLMILSTPNRTAASHILLVEGAEAIGMIPRGTHHWDDFVTPDELAELLGAVGMKMGEPTGIAFSPMRGLHLSGDLALNYIVTATLA